jgi:hypothetical protein
MKKSYELILPYFKRGDDLAFHLEKNPTVAKAFAAHAEQLAVASEICRCMAALAQEAPLEVHADTHYIGIEGPDDVLFPLTKEGGAEDPLLYLSEWDDEDEE